MIFHRHVPIETDRGHAAVLVVHGHGDGVIAGVLGIVLGGLGIHKFILGYQKEGLIMLLVSVLSCFTLAGVMHVIGIVEGIMYLTKSDEDFVRTYIQGRKGWF